MLLAVARVLQENASGRDFFQTHALPAVPDLKCHGYFKNLKSARRLRILQEADRFMRENFLPLFARHRRPLNALVVADEMVSFDNQPGQWRRITVIDPDTGEHRVLLTNEMTLAPGVLNQVRRLRWNIEKMFSEQECKLGEDKAWTADETGKRVQAMAICIACNLLRIFHDKLRREEGIEDTKVAKAWNQRLAARVTKAAELGRSFPESLYRALYRPTEVSLQFLRWLRYGLARATCHRQALARLRPLMEKYL